MEPDGVVSAKNSKCLVMFMTPKDLHARFGNGVLSIRLPKKKPSNDASDSVVNKSLLLRLKTSKMAILRIAVAVVVGVAVGGYVTFKCLASKHAIEKH
ncbi:inactive protein RESTRICTED TEV MOVEMENT 2-like [Prunus yedoensis var. nudiflora]|uniref:Inactive protein RESTRICTED TEV MOVEMENT 2-like n=1 Tax=Prunus yedoensis var. nudiflora TaxID=2094558 RepID=A0A314ZG03_PRUYE|nr:inactive protein RESTRICTED TEV MOVEMENT 2-like [Prunus yedoensis var. nudiflora]